MATISRAGISTSSTIEATHVTNIIDALDGTTSTEIRIPGSVEVTGSLKTNGTNTHSGTNIFSSTITANGDINVNSDLNLTGDSSQLLQRVKLLDNTDSVSINMSEYKSGTTFEIDCSINAGRSININLGDPQDTQARFVYYITFAAVAAAANDFIISNNGAKAAIGLNTNNNSTFSVTADTGNMTTANVNQLHTRVEITNVLNPNADKFWFIKTTSDNASIFSIT